MRAQVVGTEQRGFGGGFEGPQLALVVGGLTIVLEHLVAGLGGAGHDSDNRHYGVWIGAQSHEIADLEHRSCGLWSDGGHFWVSRRRSWFSGVGGIERGIRGRVGRHRHVGKGVFLDRCDRRDGGRRGTKHVQNAGQGIGPIRFRHAAESESLSQRSVRADAEEGVPARFRIHAIPETDMHDPERDISDIPLSQLELSPDNARKTPADDSAFTELKASIAAHGLLENLIAHSMEPGADGPGRYAVIAGGRRLAAMQALAAEGALDDDHPVPCRMIGDIVAAEEVSLAENSVRAAMHPADQVEAFRRLADAGSTAAAIAARFGVSERTVEKRLRLGNAAPVLLEAYRAGEIDLDTLMAFAVTTDQARQNAVWETVGQQGYRPGAWQIKRLLTEDRVPATSAIVRFVGLEAYEAAGGRIDRDLFAEEDERGIWFDDPNLLNKLAMDSLQAAARELETRWKWAEARLDVDWSATAAFGRVRPQPAEPTDEEKAEIERLRTRNDELANMDDDGWTEELVEEAEGNEERLDEIEATIEARAIYRREDIAIAGCIATVGNDGELKLIQGLVKPEDMPAREAGDAAAPEHGDTADGEETISGIDAPTFVAPLASPGDAEAEARKEAGVGIGLADDLRAIRTAIVYGRNLGLTFLVFGGLHLRFYMLKSQGTRYMLNRREPTATHRRFLFGNQVRENVFWTAVSGVGVWTAYEVVTLCAFANGYIPMLSWEAHPIYFVLLLCAIPIIRDAYSYFVHRLLHYRFLYKSVHALHHKNVDIGPWSGMSMHPVEHVLYFGGVLLHWILLSHPLHAIFHVQQAGLAPALGHLGFHRLLTKGENEYSIGQRYFHYLHHRYFECNYGGDGTVPLDKWFGSWHDGTPESHEIMRARRKKAHGI